jgi:hypothetical protein
MEAILSIASEHGGFRETGTEGRSVVKDASLMRIVKRAAALQRRWHGRAVRVEEYRGSIYALKPTKTWIYACACDLGHACEFHTENPEC